MGRATLVVNYFPFSNVQTMQHDLFHGHTTSRYECVQGEGENFQVSKDFMRFLRLHWETFSKTQNLQIFKIQTYF